MQLNQFILKLETELYDYKLFAAMEEDASILKDETCGHCGSKNFKVGKMEDTVHFGEPEVTIRCSNVPYMHCFDCGLVLTGWEAEMIYTETLLNFLKGDRHK